MKQNTKRKAKYQETIGELEAKEPEWHSLEKILRNAIARLCTVGKGLDKNLDQLLQQVTETVKQQRYDLFMRKQREISAQKLKQRVGKDLQVLLEQKTDGGYAARSYADAPEIDGLVHVDTEKSLSLGEFYQVRVYDSDEYDCYGHLY